MCELNHATESWITMNRYTNININTLIISRNNYRHSWQRLWLKYHGKKQSFWSLTLSWIKWFDSLRKESNWNVDTSRETPFRGAVWKQQRFLNSSCVFGRGCPNDVTQIPEVIQLEVLISLHITFCLFIFLLNIFTKSTLCSTFLMVLCVWIVSACLVLC